MGIVANAPVKVRDTMFSIALVVPVIITGLLSPFNPITLSITLLAVGILIALLFLRGKMLYNFFRSHQYSGQQVLEVLTLVLCFYIFSASVLILAFIGCQSILALFF